MSDDVTLQEIDRDDAAAEALAGIREDTTRAMWLKRAGLVVGGGLLAGAVPLRFAGAQGGLSKGDVKILNYALTLEYLEAAFYAEAVSKGKLKGSVANFAQVVSEHESAHVTALEKVLGSQAVKKPSFDFKGTTGAQKTFLSTSKTLEDTGVSAYQGQASNIESKEARHAAWVRDLIGAGKELKPAPDAFNKALSMEDVLAAVDGTGFIK